MSILEELLEVGQSNAMGSSATALSTTQAYNNVMLTKLAGVSGTTGIRTPQDRLVDISEYTTLIPAVEEVSNHDIQQQDGSNRFNGNVINANGAYGETGLVAMTNYLSAFDSTKRYAVGAAGCGGATYAKLASGDVYDNGMVQVQAFHNLYAGAGHTAHKVLGIPVQHGESNYNDVTYGASLSTWLTNLTASIKAITGQTENPVMIMIQTNDTLSPIASYQQLLATQQNSRIFIACPCYFLPGNTPGGHRNATGQRTFGAYAGRVYKRVVSQGGSWTPTQPTAATFSGKTITITFAVPVSPLVFDTSTVSAQANMGFAYTDGSSSASISSVSVSGNSVILRMTATPSGANKIVTYGAATGIGNLRDSDTETDLSSVVLRNWCVKFSIGVTPSGTYTDQPARTYPGAVTYRAKL